VTSHTTVENPVHHHSSPYFRPATPERRNRSPATITGCGIASLDEAE
jgi:hypothetical protein